MHINKWKLVLYGLFVVGFVDLHYAEMKDLLVGVSSPKAQSRVHRLVRRYMAESPTTLSTSVPIACEYSADCNQGTCVLDRNIRYCECDAGYLSRDADGAPSSVPCDYKQLTSLAMFLISFFVGGCGIDWCYAARGDGCYICLGVLKGLTLGGVAIWWLVDWIRVLAGDFDDGNGVPLYENM